MGDEDGKKRKRKLEPSTQTRFYKLDGTLLCDDTREAFVYNTVTSGVLGIFPVGDETMSQLQERLATKLRPVAATLLFAHFFGSGHASPWLVNANRPPAHVRIFHPRQMQTSAIGWSREWIEAGNPSVLACKVVSTGARSLNATVLNIKQIGIRLERVLNCRFELLRIRLRNFLLSLRLTCHLDIKAIAEKYYWMVTYDQSSFPGCSMKFVWSAADGHLEPLDMSVHRRKSKSANDGDRITATCFSTGMVNIAGCKSIEDGMSAFEHVIMMIRPFALGPVSIDESPFDVKCPTRVSQKDRRRLGNQTHRSLSANDNEWYLSKRFTAATLKNFPLTDTSSDASSKEWDSFIRDTFLCEK